VFTGVQARGLYSFDSCWSQVQAEGIDLRQSHLRACDFTEANLRGSDFSEACLWRCRFLRTDLRQSNAFAFSQISSAWLECLIESARWVGGVVADVGPNG
jgi:uncharacterized protein YjbI with pentapeptide repeats